MQSFVLHGEPAPFRALCDEILRPDTRYLVLDLDRTTHLGRNLGELLGWELTAYDVYGDDTLDRLETARGGSRVALDWSSPKLLARYIAKGADIWALPGLYYLVFGKIASNVAWMRKQSFRIFGPEPVRVVQRSPQMALLKYLADVPQPVLRSLARRVWDRHTDDQVITAGDIARIRSRCPNIEVIISSASPGPMVEVAAEALGADLACFSTLSQINSGPAKIERITELRPDFADPEVDTVGISDTGYGEDHCWTKHFSRVADINSTSPYPPILMRGDRTTEIHSAAVLTNAEVGARAAKDPTFLSSKRKPATSPTERRFTRDQLATRLDTFAREIDRLLSDSNSVNPTHNAFRIAQLLEESRAALNTD